MEDLVIKLTDRCNFRCDFCSSNNIAKNHDILDISVLKSYLKKNMVRNIIVNGGDPLMVPPEYYWELIDFIKSELLPCTISFTTNLWDFYEHPEKWTDLFKSDFIWTATSFQYGGGRKLASGVEFTEDMFRNVYALYKELIGKPLPFIAVVDETNENYCMKTIELAKDLETTCRLNPKLRSGRAITAYPYWKMFKIYLDIIEQGLDKYEMNSKLLKWAWEGTFKECPYTFECGTIKCMNPDGSVTTCASISDDIMTDDMPEHFRTGAGKVPFALTYINEACFACEMYDICCSCHKRILDIRDAKLEKEHCTKMREQFKRAREILGEKAKKDFFKRPSDEGTLSG